ncbi:MAG: aminopeptidase [Nitrososphaerales archaeon]
MSIIRLSEEEMKEIAHSLVVNSMRIGRIDDEFESVRIIYNSTDADCQAFALAIEEECWKLGAYTLILPYSSKREKLRYLLTPEESVARLSRLAKSIAESIDVTMFIGEQDEPDWARYVTEKLRLSAPVRLKLREILDERKVRWLYFGWPIEGAARGYGCDLEKFRRIYFNSIRESFSKRTLELCNYYGKALTDKEFVEIKADDGTYLKFSIKGRPILIDDGIISDEDIARGDVGLNIPSGEVFVAPLETTANGKILFEDVVPHGFGKVKNLMLEFKDGKVVRYSAEKGEENFTKFLDANTGEKDRIAELGIGCNPGAEYTGGSIIVDEKIFHTIHIAIGNNTGASHGKNKASSHLDMIKFMTHGRLFVDGKLIMEKGEPTQI